MDLRLDGIDGRTHRDLHFTGERDALSAVIAVVESIPAALADIDPDGDIDLEAVVGSLPVFEDLEKLAALGTFTSRDLTDISETMHQGALLVLESGVILVDEPAPTGAASGGRSSRDTLSAASASRASAPSAVAARAVPDAVEASSASVPAARTAVASRAPDPVREEAPLGAARAGSTAGSSAIALDGDEHYERYLREREAMQRPATNGAVDRTAEQRRDAVEELLRSLDQSRNGG